MNANEDPGARAELEQAMGPAEMAYGHGGVPWYLLLGYLAFLVFFTWYVLEYQLPDYLERGPGRAQQTSDAPPAAPR
jgi:hypothetical protein